MCFSAYAQRPFLIYRMHRTKCLPTLLAHAHFGSDIIGKKFQLEICFQLSPIVVIRPKRPIFIAMHY